MINTLEKRPWESKINVLALLGILLPYVNEYLSEITGMPVVIEPEAAYNAILIAIIAIRTLWTNSRIKIT